MKMRTSGMSTKGLFLIIETHLLENGPSTCDQMAAANPQIDKQDFRDALKMLNGRSIVRLPGSSVAVYEYHGRRNA